MATGSDIITRALTKLGVRASETPLEAAELADGLDALNDMLSEWEYSGIRLNFERLTNAAETVNVPDGALGCIKSQLAVRLAAEYGRQISPALVAEADLGMDNLLISLAHLGDVELPDTLPTGSGNRITDFAEDTFFAQNTTDNF